MKMRHSILVSLMLAGANLAMSAPAHAQTVWRTWGSCPFAETQKDAMDRFEEAIKNMSMPEEVKAEFRKLIVTNSDKGSARTVKPGDHFQEMQSCKGHLMKGGILVGEYLDTQGKTQEGHTIQATEWHVDYQGKRYTLTLPDTCFNWAWEISEIPVPKEVPPPVCYELHVPTHAGDRATFRIRSGGATLPPYDCRVYTTASGVKAAWPTCFDCFVADGRIVIYVDRKIADNYEIEICWEHEGTPSRQGVVPPNAWVDGKFEVPDLETIAPIPKGGGS